MQRPLHSSFRPALIGCVALVLGACADRDAPSFVPGAPPQQAQKGPAGPQSLLSVSAEFGTDSPILGPSGGSKRSTAVALGGNGHLVVWWDSGAQADVSGESVGSINATRVAFNKDTPLDSP